MIGTRVAPQRVPAFVAVEPSHMAIVFGTLNLRVRPPRVPLKPGDRRNLGNVF
jgi:hypothetical protein